MSTPTARHLRRATAVVAAAGALLWTTACGQDALGRDRLQTAVSTTFTNLYDLRQQQLGHPAPGPALATTARCDKGGPSVADSGPGDTWSCLVVWQAEGPGTPVDLTYDVRLQADGCFTADGPPTVADQPQGAVAGGPPGPDPVASFDGCFDTT